MQHEQGWKILKLSLFQQYKLNQVLKAQRFYLIFSMRHFHKKISFKNQHSILAYLNGSIEMTLSDFVAMPNK